MDAWVWIVLILIAVVVVAGIVALTRGRERRLETKRAEASALRERAEMCSEQAERREAIAEEQAREARREREAAEATVQRADELDPDVEDRSARDTSRDTS